MLAVVMSALAVTVAATPSAEVAGVMHQYASVALSPDGREIASVETVREAFATSEQHGAVVIRSSDGKVVDRIDVCPKCKYSGLIWAREGRRLAFVASADGVATLYTAKAGQDPQHPVVVDRVAEVKGLLESPRWSPDGRSVAVLATVGAHKETGAVQAGVREVGELGGSDDSQRIGVTTVPGGELKFVSPDGTYVYEYDWMPDGRGFVATAAQGNGDNNWWVARLESFTLEGTQRVILAPSMQMNYPRVSPDGHKVAFIGGLMSDFGSVGGDVYVVDIGGGKPVDVTPGFNGSFRWLAWRGKGLVTGLVQGGSEGSALLDPAGTSKVSDVHLEAATYTANVDGSISLDRTGHHVALVSESFEHAPRIEYGVLGATQPVTHDNDALQPPGKAQDIHWKSDAFSVQGWLYSPQGVQPDRKYPMILVVHGGPAAVETPRFLWDNMMGGWLRHGYFVFQPNPRGSYGQGEAFTRANVKDFGGGDLRDDLAGVDAVEKVAPIDDAKLGLYGRSYGGFMTMWIVTQSQRFKVAASGAGISDWVAYYGQNGIDQWMIPFFGASAYDDPGTYDRMSPIRYIKAAHTPMFLYVGERDVECPAEQTREYWHALREFNVPTSLVVYADEGHHLVKPENVADLNRRLINWFDQYLK
jgi:dipeptidyl aminopeptidase/acylaminoacyl peptidase